MRHVAMTCPTFNRPEYNRHLYEQFTGQLYPSKSLWVLDDSPAPSMFFTHLRDPRVHYSWTPTRHSIGTKRNMVIDQAVRGGADVIVHQDDDDHYKPHYLGTMVGRLGDSALTKLSVWDARSAYDGSIWRWDTRKAGPIHYAVSGSAPAVLLATGPTDDEARESALWGYGFSYVYPREAWEACPFPDQNAGEDLDFINRLRALMPDEITHQADIPSIVLHTLHRASTSRSFPQECIGWCKPCAMAEEQDMSYAAPASQQSGQAEVPTKISLVPGRTYSALALVKNRHNTRDLTSRAGSYGLTLLKMEDNVQPPGLPAPRSGYRYVRVRVKAKEAKTVRTAIPWPFSAGDETRVVQVA